MVNTLSISGALGAIKLTVAVSSSTPTLVFNFIPFPLLGDIITVFDNGSSLGTYTLTSTDTSSGTFTLGFSTLSAGTHNLTANVTRSGVTGPTSNTVTIVV